MLLNMFNWKLELLEKEILPLLPLLTQGGVAYGGLFLGRDSVQVKLDYSHAEVRVWPDADNHPLINPPRRSVEKQDINLREILGGGTLHTARAGRLWKKLGLIDDSGRPTERGHIASLCQHGEGLDEDYERIHARRVFLDHHGGWRRRISARDEAQS